ncbi:MAG: hypothetical protein HQM04_19090 [Magnetococcales bacterium]|nr:hypothetical protein [Magnetococcales bacterium]MBF0117134.1 hypothetical protein [Magnetococcales bacterium]
MQSRNRMVWLVPLFMLAAGELLAGASPVAEQQEERIGEALHRARNALQEAAEALSEAGRLTVDQQLPKLKAQTDQALRSTQKMLKQWENQLPKEPSFIPLPPPEREEEEEEAAQQAHRI